MFSQEIIYHFYICDDVSICTAIQCDQLESTLQVHLSDDVGHVTDPLGRARIALFDTAYFKKMNILFE